MPTIELEDTLRASLGEPSSAALEAVLSKYQEARSRLHLVEAELRALPGQWATTVAAIPWTAVHDAASQEYEALKTLVREAAGDADLAGYSKLVEQRTELESRVKRLAEHEASLARLRIEGASLLQQAEVHERLLRSERERAIASWLQVSPGEGIKVTLIHMGNRDMAVTQLREIVRKPGGEFVNDITRLLAEIPMPGGTADPWDALVSVRSTLREATAADPKGLDRRFVRHLEHLRLTTPEDFDRLALWTPEDRLKLELVKADGTIEDIETGSAGQRTAGVLGLILALDDSPLVIDQPEDDLETRLISSIVVSSIRRLKKKQQVIIVSHNPNIPVNGAAEQIVEMKFAAGEIRVGTMGALQRQEVRRGVCEVMEGGKDALDKRYYRISRALS
jgi:hypothetical protein